MAAGELKLLSVHKRNSHSKNRPNNPEGIHKHLKRISGVDLSVVDGFGLSQAQTVIIEVGTDMSKFPSEKYFCSWLGFAPKYEISGGKLSWKSTRRNTRNSSSNT